MRLRQITCIILAVCLCVALGTVSVSASAGHVYSVVDIVRVARAIATQTQLSEEEMALYDTNGDGMLTIIDVVGVAEWVIEAMEANAPATQQPSVQQPSAQPTVCPDCAHYPCVCSSGTNQQYVCANCGQYPCVCGSGWGSQQQVCARCGQYPCVCYGGGHHGGGWHHGWSHC